MSSLVSDFIINPVLRQARRFSEISRSTIAGDGERPTDHTDSVSDASPNNTPDSDPRPPSVPETPPPRPRPLSSSTQETRVDDPLLEPVMAEDPPQRDHISLALSPAGSRRIPEDDGMRELRGRIHVINAQDIPSTDKAKLIHDMLLEGYRASKTGPRVIEKGPERLEAPESPTPSARISDQSPLARAQKLWQQHMGDSSSNAEKFVLTAEDITPSYVPIKPRKNSSSEAAIVPDVVSGLEQPLGCQHYERNVKLQCFTCKKWYTCRFCHDANEDHNLVRTETRNMLCMLCATPQKASDVCINCGETTAHYYCNICKLWENRQNKPIYHCNDCGICRRGIGLGKDFFHCKTCRACISTSIESSHKCIERSTDCDCPICGEYLFTSPRPVVFMGCGHSIHKKCYDQHMKVSYKCPICNKSLANMESQFRNLDVAIQSQPMPPEFRDTTAVILCNDCSGKSTVRYHWLGLKCSICRSYNTVELNILSGDQRQVQPPPTEDGQPSVEVAEPPPRTSSNSVSRTAIHVPNRRRHSSHGIEAQYRAPDRIARSVSPMNMGFDNIMAFLEANHDNMLGLWRGRDGDDEEGSGSYETDSDDEVSHGPSDIEEEEEDDNDIMLIGHR